MYHMSGWKEGLFMDFLEWADVMTENQREEFAALDDSEVMDYLNEHDIALPDEWLEDVAGGINPFAMLGQMLKRKLTGR